MNWRDLAKYDEGFTEYGGDLNGSGGFPTISHWKTIILRRIGWFSWSGRLARVLEEQFRF